VANPFLQGAKKTAKTAKHTAEIGATAGIGLGVLLLVAALGGFAMRNSSSNNGQVCVQFNQVFLSWMKHVWLLSNAKRAACI
jgi:hypothetical protein